MRQDFSERQEILSEDLDRISARIEKQFYDRILSFMLRDTKNAFLKKVLKQFFLIQTQ